MVTWKMIWMMPTVSMNRIVKHNPKMYLFIAEF